MAPVEEPEVFIAGLANRIVQEFAGAPWDGVAQLRAKVMIMSAVTDYCARSSNDANKALVKRGVIELRIGHSTRSATVALHLS